MLSARVTAVTLGPTPDTRIALGRSGLSVAPLGWGMWHLAGTDAAGARLRVEAALETGCQLFDTADVYGYRRGSGFGDAEALLGAVLRDAPQLRERMVLATKAGIDPRVPYDSSPAYLVAACEASLRRLGVERIDLWQIHRPDLLAHPAEVAAVFERLQAAGKIRAAGVSNYSAAQFEALARHVGPGLASVQNEFSALVIGGLEDGTLDAAMGYGAGVLAWSPLAQGRLVRTPGRGGRAGAHGGGDRGPRHDRRPCRCVAQRCRLRLGDGPPGAAGAADRQPEPGAHPRGRPGLCGAHDA